jgi:hypothetical protein
MHVPFVTASTREAGHGSSCFLSVCVWEVTMLSRCVTEYTGPRKRVKNDKNLKNVGGGVHMA